MDEPRLHVFHTIPPAMPFSPDDSPASPMSPSTHAEVLSAEFK